MAPIRFLSALRRRWWVTVGSVVVASVAAWVTTPASSSPKVATAPQTTYNATTTLWNTHAPTIGQEVPLPAPDRLANLVSLPDVASIAAQGIDPQGNPGALGSQVYATVDPVTGLLDITGTAATPERAVAVSTAYSRALITYLERLKQQRISLRQLVVQRQIRTLQRRGSDADQIASLRSTLSQLELDRTTPIPLVILQPATAVRDAAPNPVQQSNGIGEPKSLPLWIALAALLGLLAGLVLTLVLELFDTRIRSPRAAEHAFGLPVLAEVPAISRRRRGTIVTASHPSSRAADAFSLIVVGTARWTSVANGSGNGHASRAKTFLVTSPEPRDGKTTVAANLAVAYAEAGSRVVVVSCDLRRPAIHKAFGVDEQPGLVDLLERTSGDARPASETDLSTYLEPCSVVRVAVIPSGTASERPRELLGSAEMQRVLERLKKITDVIILDCGPLVVAGDVAPLLPQVDGVIVVARARRTRQELAGSTAALLERLGTTTAGVVLNDAREFSIPLARRRMYRPTRRMRKAAKRDVSPGIEEPSMLDPDVQDAPVVEDAPVVVADAPVVVEDAPVVESIDSGDRPRSTVFVDEGEPAVRVPELPHREVQVLVAERVVQIPPAEEAHDQHRPRTDAVFLSLQEQLVELRAQLEGLHLELPDVVFPGLNRSTQPQATDGTFPVPAQGSEAAYAADPADDVGADPADDVGADLHKG